MSLRVAVLAGAALVFGCEGDPELVQCDEAPDCPVFDEDAAEGDVRVLWEPGQTVELSLDGVPSSIEIVGGEVVFTPDPDDPDCDGACVITLKRLRLRLKQLYFVSSDDSVKVSGLELAIKAPADLDNPDGVGSALPAETETLTCATVQGLLWAHQSTLGQPAVLATRTTREALTFEFRTLLSIDGSTAYGCRPFELELSGKLVGAVPFEQNPAAAE